MKDSEHNTDGRECLLVYFMLFDVDPSLLIDLFLSYARVF